MPEPGELRRPVAPVVDRQPEVGHEDEERGPDPRRASSTRRTRLPLLGVAPIAFPRYELVKPGQPAPYNRFPLICAAIIVVAVLYGAVLARRRPGLADRVGSIVADSD